MRLSRIALAALGLPLLAGCYSNETLGLRTSPSGGALFRNYIAIGTSISAGVQSGGINDSTQKRAFPVLLAQAMGLTVGGNWFYPSLTMPGCPPPFTNPLTGARVTPAGYPTSTGTSCYVMNPAYASANGYENNLGVPFMRLGQALNIRSVPFPATDTLQLANFITGARSPVDILLQAQPTFVTVELGANDVLHAANSGDSTLLTPLATFQRQYDSLAAGLATTGAKVALVNVPNVSNIPYLTRGHIFFCLKTGACPGVPATLPFSLATFTVDPSCAPTAAGGVGDKMAVALPATATIAGTLSGGGAASLNCGAGTATVTTTATAPVGPIVSVATLAAVTQRVVDYNTKISSVATAHSWALVNLDSAMAVLVAGGQIPPIPALATPTNLFGTYISLDGEHPTAAGSKLIADLCALSINAKFGTVLPLP
jgi:lysophospholipase L1-like esterase